MQQIAACYWRLARLLRAEAGDIALRQSRAEADRNFAKRWCNSDPEPPYTSAERAQVERKALESALSEPTIAAVRAFVVARDPSLADAPDAEILDIAHRWLADLRQRCADHERHRAAIQEAVRSLPEPEMGLRYTRYETTLQNQLNRAYIRLERLQRQRIGHQVPPPLQIDLSLEPDPR